MIRHTAVRVLSLLLLTAALCILCSCANNTAGSDAQTLPTVINSTEYVLYTNIFYNNTGDTYIGQTWTKVGTYATLRDSFNQCTRYYVWGYNDQTKCCDWQWEFVPKDPASLPTVGSLVEVTGVFRKDADALDGYRIADAAVKVRTAFSVADCDLPLTAMSDTLERVQLINLQRNAGEYEGKRILAYGRIAAAGSIEDPYYNGSWTQPFSSSDPLPAIGTMVILRGTVKNGVISDCTVTPTDAY